MPAPVSHRRPVNVLATASSRSVAQEVGALRADYFGPTGAQTVLQVALGEAGIRAVGFWAQVPHYVAATPSPPAIRAMLERLREVAGLTVDLRALDEQSDAYLERVEEGLSERPDVADMVRQLEAADRGRRGGVRRGARPRDRAVPARRALTARPNSKETGVSVVKINAITVEPERADELVARFAARAGEVGKMDGFEAFELLQAERRPEPVPRVHAVALARRTSSPG